MKIVRSSMICLVYLFGCSALIPAQTNDTPESRVKSFYSWYLTTLAKGKDPTKNKTAMKDYLSLKLNREHYSKPGRKPNSGFFFNSGDWKAAWADNIEVGEPVYLYEDKPVLRLTLRSPPDEFLMELQVRLVKEGGKWKIDWVRRHLRSKP